MRTDFGDLQPDGVSARKTSGNVHPPAVPIAASVPILSRSRRERPSQKSRVEWGRQAIVNMHKLRQRCFQEVALSSWSVLYINKSGWVPSDFSQHVGEWLRLQANVVAERDWLTPPTPGATILLCSPRSSTISKRLPASAEASRG